MDTNIDDNQIMEEGTPDLNFGMPDPQKTKKPRKIKPLPEELARLAHCTTNREFLIAKEADTNNKSTQFGKEIAAVQSVHVMKDDKEVIFNLKLPNVDQLQQLCKNISVINCGKSTKFWCQVLIANYFTYKKSLTNQGLRHQTQEQQTTSTIHRAINVVFSDNFIVDFKQSTAANPGSIMKWA
jgi:hypothetical protein